MKNKLYTILFCIGFCQLSLIANETKKYVLKTQETTFSIDDNCEVNWRITEGNSHANIMNPNDESSSSYCTVKGIAEGSAVIEAYSDEYGEEKIYATYKLEVFTLKFVTPKQLNDDKDLNIKTEGLKSGKGKNMYLFSRDNRRRPIPIVMEIEIEPSNNFPEEENLADYISDLSVELDKLDNVNAYIIETMNISFRKIFITYKYETLPDNNNGFGKKTAIIKSGNNIITSTKFAVFFNRQLLNNDNKSARSVYFSQTSAGAPKDENFILYHSDANSSATFFEPPYKYYVGCYDDPTEVEYGANGGSILESIDLYAWAMRHEVKHHFNYTIWWANAPYNPSLDDDNDRIPNTVENFMINDGYNPNNSHSKHATDNDDQYYTCMNAQVWVVGSADSEDWSDLGKQYKQ